MFIKVIKILAYIFSGIFVAEICTLSFFNMDSSPEGFEFKIFSICVTLFVVPLLIGLAIDRFQSWERDSGIIILSASILSFVAMSSAYLIVFDPEIQKLLPKNQKPLTRDIFTFLTGVIVSFSFISIGGILLWLGLRKKS
ncbi:hypothetical protein [Leptospira saintgironsiae]|uniref:Uncharacterized protein n=1 Tax=Leptospira saintgironsiae TaxID=2023183 RepID=A0A2M9YGS0_9LEPT|nr:hypothetical protein [Leptospira saintgironsiae]PJZ50724.1 hypothetical protein CH362_02875 [Leptospira saintgironsiae]